jgi:hypothetical protein
MERLPWRDRRPLLLRAGAPLPVARWPTSSAEWPSPERWLRWQWLAVEAGSLRTALTWSLSQPGEARTGARLAVALWRFWEMQGG